MSAARRLEVLVDQPLAARVAAVARSCGVTNFHLLPTLSGLGEHGEWFEDALTGATAKLLFVTILNAERAADLTAALTPLLDSHDLLMTTTEVEVVRGGLF